MFDKLVPGNVAPDFILPAARGGGVNLSKVLRKHEVVLVMFICNHCPYVKAYIPRLIALQERFADRLCVLGICSNDWGAYPEDSFENMGLAADGWGLNFKYLHDEDQSVAKIYGAERTPEIFLLDSDGVCRYEGGIDDNYKDASGVTDSPLIDAIEDLLKGESVRREQTFAIGCTIKWMK